MKTLYIGDIMGEPGIQVVEQVLPKVRKEHQPHLVIAQAENVSDGRGITLEDYNRLKKIGVDFFTGGNWSLHHDEIIQAMNDFNQPIVRPANYPDDTPGKGYKYISTNKGQVLVISLIGQIVGRDANKETDNPLLVLDRILEEQKDEKRVATFVNFHGDYSSEKVVIGHYADGKVTAVIGDHWHIPTADARVLPKGTAHITDVGMCGALNASLGVKLNVIIQRWHDQIQNRNELEDDGPLQFNAVLVMSDDASGLATGIESINLTF